MAEEHDGQVGGAAPSTAAVERLRAGLRGGIDAYGRDVDQDVAAAAGAVAGDRDDLALRVLRDHIARLEGFADEVRRVVAGAVVEREAEAVVDAALVDAALVDAALVDAALVDAALVDAALADAALADADLARTMGAAPAAFRPAPSTFAPVHPVPSPPATTSAAFPPPGAMTAMPSPAPTPTAPPAAHEAPTRPAHGVLAGAQRALAMAAVVAVVSVLAVSIRPGTTADPLLAAVAASEGAEAAALDAAAGSAAGIDRLGVLTTDLREAIAALDQQVLADPAVRSRVEAILADHQRALVSLAGQVPQAGSMLQQLRDLAARLDLRLPDLPATLPDGGVPGIVLPGLSVPDAGPDAVLPAVSLPAATLPDADSALDGVVPVLEDVLPSVVQDEGSGAGGRNDGAGSAAEAPAQPGTSGDLDAPADPAPDQQPADPAPDQDPADPGQDPVDPDQGSADPDADPPTQPGGDLGPADPGIEDLLDDAADADVNADDAADDNADDDNAADDAADDNADDAVEDVPEAGLGFPDVLTPEGSS